jgi:hypothetical protein
LTFNREKILGTNNFQVDEKPKKISYAFNSGQKLDENLNVIQESKSQPAILQEIKLHGQTIQIIMPSSFDEKKIADILKKLEKFCKPLNQNIIKSLRTIIFDPAGDPQDAYFGNLYGYKKGEFKAAANAGRDTITFHYGEQNFNDKIFWHELGHILTKQMVDSHDPGPDWKDAKIKDGNEVSRYGKVAFAEDFAEFARIYVEAMARQQINPSSNYLNNLCQQYPNRSKNFASRFLVHNAKETVIEKKYS